MFQGYDVIIDDFEINSSKKNYTIYTIEYLLNKYIDCKLTMVLGADQLENIGNWYESDKIFVSCFDYCGAWGVGQQNQNRCYKG